MYCAYMIDKGKTQSSTIKSYVSAIKSMVKLVRYKWNDSRVELTSLTRACKKLNDRLTCKIPIQRYLMEIILFEVCRIFKDQPYLSLLYKAIFSLAYYDLMRVGELTQGEHPVKAADLSIGNNKNKILLILYSSKTHTRADFPQKKKISEARNKDKDKKPISINGKKVTFFCPFKIVNNYRKARGGYEDINENLFVFRDKTPVKPNHVSEVLKNCLINLNLDHTAFSFQCFRSGRACDLLRQGYTVEEIKYLGRWKSNAVYKYLKL